LSSLQNFPDSGRQAWHLKVSAVPRVDESRDYNAASSAALFRNAGFSTSFSTSTTLFELVSAILASSCVHILARLHFRAIITIRDGVL
jgi:hypothetical protein